MTKKMDKIKQNAAETKKLEEKIITVYKLGLKRMSITLVGQSPLLMHNFSSKTVEALKNKITGEGRQKNKIVVPQDAFTDALYYVLEKGEKKYFVPALWLKKAMVWVCGSSDVDFITATRANGEFFVRGVTAAADKAFLKEHSEPQLDETWCRVGGHGSGATLTYRGRIDTWKADFEIDYNSNILTDGQVLFLIRLAGFKNGFGDWRAQKGGNSFGAFGYDDTSVKIVDISR